MRKSVVVVGIGEIGSVFARGFLRTGFTVYPVTRDMSMQEVAAELSGELSDRVVEPELVLIAVAEADLESQLANIPEEWEDKLVLLQNELLPGVWQKHGLDPTVISVWFEKKKGQDSKVIIPSPVFGNRAQMVVDALSSIDIAARVLADEAALLHELVLKNVYILTTNIAGLEVGGNVCRLWDQHNDVANAVAIDVIHLQEKLVGKALDYAALIESMVEAFNGDKEHMCMGRSASVRLQRALKHAKENGLSLPTLERIAALHEN